MRCLLRLLILFLLFVTLVTISLADYEVVVPAEPEQRFTKNIRFVVDVSGSMNRTRLMAAISTVLHISQQPIDEMQIALITFDTNHAVWPGHPEPDAYKPVPAGWAALPNLDITGDPEDKTKIGELEQFIQRHAISGNTDPRSAFREAIDDRKDLTIVVVSDGEWLIGLGSDPTTGLPQFADPVSTVIPAKQQERVDKGLAPAVLVFYAVTDKKNQSEGVDANFRSYARRFGGGYIRYVEPPEAAERESLSDDLLVTPPTGPY